MRCQEEGDIFELPVQTCQAMANSNDLPALRKSFKPSVPKVLEVNAERRIFRGDEVVSCLLARLTQRSVIMIVSRARP